MRSHAFACSLPDCLLSQVMPLTKVDAVDATCTATGNSEYYKCTDADCGKFFSDAEGTEEIEKDSWVIAAKGTATANGRLKKAATFFGKGVEKRVCANDASHTESRDIAAIGSLRLKCLTRLPFTPTQASRETTA